MSNFSNITVNHHENDKVSLLIDGQPISERYDIHHEKSVIDELKALDDGQALKLFEQFIFSHQDLNLEHAYLYSTCIVKKNDAYEIARNFVYRLTVSGQAPSEHVITNQGKAMSPEDIKKFIENHVEMSLTKYTDLKYAY
ncbi:MULTISPECIES: hypothetical protein [Acinetobacter]|uniref:Uncharacterized protein n=1 Tax=Acinetobacter piscicola TaxID=2006115 RepID=A0A4Q4GZF1_9GAMM|nr:MULTISPECIES: hypothetical protein [Acinetobacter]MDM1756440.1 hypothetical protein [Acinetobacter sp. 256-1]MDM1761606.1 hypothetical protein [Acinetobacter sp. 251-1]QOW45894.1 hypothetical protein G0028_08295 [Acinetobacter piscicola]RYL26672.1 hypothetical protein EWP19_08710 [Acinetobacter piscicola]